MKKGIKNIIMICCVAFISGSIFSCKSQGYGCDYSTSIEQEKPESALSDFEKEPRTTYIVSKE